MELGAAVHTHIQELRAVCAGARLAISFHQLQRTDSEMVLSKYIQGGSVLSDVFERLIGRQAFFKKILSVGYS